MTSRRLVRRIADVVALGVTIGFAWLLWPTSLGGSSRLVLVQGHSMEPAYAPGELVFLDTDIEPHIGRVVVFEIPEGQLGAGHLVVHRIIDQRPDGTYVTQGDNSQNPDDFRVARSNILGAPRFSLPGGAYLLRLLSSPVGIGGAAGLTCAAALWPRKRIPHLVSLASVGLAIDHQGWSSLRLSDQVKCDADAWLQSQLERTSADQLS